jgi:hypothetical protein
MIFCCENRASGAPCADMMRPLTLELPNRDCRDQTVFSRKKELSRTMRVPP